MINFAIFGIGIIFSVITIVFAVWSANATRNKYYHDFMRRKSEREKLRLPR